MGAVGGRRRRKEGIALILAASLWTSVPSAAQPAGEWGGGAPLPEPRRLLAAASEEGRLYAFGGCGSPCFSPPQHVAVEEETRVEVYDPGADRWQRRRPMPYVFFDGAAAAPRDGFVYTIGGMVSPGVVERYDPAADAWSRRAALPTPRHGLAAAAIDGLIYVVGGSDGRRASGALEIYDPAADAWTRGPPLPTPRARLAAAAVGGRLYAIGGSPDCCGGGTSAAVEVYDPATGAWSAAAPLPSPRQVSAAAAIDGRLFVFGGFVPGTGVLAETLEYDPEADRWTRLADLPTPRDQAAVAALAGRALLVGGSVDCHCRALSAVESFRPPPVIVPAADLACTLAAPASLAAGDRAVYALTVTNGGPGAAVGALVTARLPPQLIGRRWTCRASAGAACGAAGFGGLAERVDLPPGGSVRFDLTGTVSAAGACPVPLTLAASASARASGDDELSPADDACAASTAYAPRADLAVALETVSVGVAELLPARFTVVVDNLGPDAACGATLAATLPPALGPALWTCAAPGPCSPPAGGAPGVLDLPPNASADLTVTAGVFDGAEGCRLAVAVAAPPGTLDPDPANNRAAADLDLPGCPPPLPIPALGGSAQVLLVGLLAALAVLGLRGRWSEPGRR
jgi:N-acetylneuraminic acid mutarotase